MVVGDLVTSYFELVAPALASFTDWKFLTNRGKTEVFIFKHAYDDYKSLKFKGQLIWQPMLKSMCFVGSPLLDSIEDLDYFGLNLSDFAAHDPTKDALFLNHAKDANLQGSRDDGVADSSSTVASSLSSSSSGVSLVSSSSCLSLPDASSSSSSNPGGGLSLSPLPSESPPPSTAGNHLAVPPPSPSHSGSSAFVSPRSVMSSHQSQSDSSSAQARRLSATGVPGGGCPFGNPSSSASTLKSNAATKDRQQGSPPPAAAPVPASLALRSPQSSASLLDKLFGSKQKSSYAPIKPGKADKTSALLHSVGGGNQTKSLSRPQPLRALLSAAGGGLIGIGGNGTAASAGSADDVDDLNSSGSGRKRSKSCSDSDELLAIEEQMRAGGPLPSPASTTTSSSSSKQRRGGAGGLVPLVSDEEAVRAAAAGRRRRGSPSPLPPVQTIPPAGPLSLQGRERLENAFQEVHQLFNSTNQN